MSSIETVAQVNQSPVRPAWRSRTVWILLCAPGGEWLYT